MATFKKKGGATSAPQLYFIGKQFPGNATYGETPGDAGVIIKLLGARNDEKLIRLYGIQKFDGKKSYQCGRCGLKFISEHFREAHGRLRHRTGGPRFVDMNQLSPEAKARLVAEAGQAGLKRGDDGYEVDPGEFHTPDPEDHVLNLQERQLSQEIDWSKTAASRR